MGVRRTEVVGQRGRGGQSVEAVSVRKRRLEPTEVMTHISYEAEGQKLSAVKNLRWVYLTEPWTGCSYLKFRSYFEP